MCGVVLCVVCLYVLVNVGMHLCTCDWIYVRRTIE